MAKTSKQPRLVRFDFPKGTSAKHIAKQLAQMKKDLAPDIAPKKLPGTTNRT